MYNDTRVLDGAIFWHPILSLFFFPRLQFQNRINLTWPISLAASRLVIWFERIIWDRCWARAERYRHLDSGVQSFKSSQVDIAMHMKGAASLLWLIIICLSTAQLKAGTSLFHHLICLCSSNYKAAWLLSAVCSKKLPVTFAKQYHTIIF